MTTSTVRFWKWDKAQLATVYSVSGDGAFLKTQTALEHGEHLTVRLQLPGERGMTLLARVVQVETPSAVKLGGATVRFVDASPQQRQCIDEHFARRAQAAA